eukprot:Platyproteum_vivax@DN1579_c0_g1_i1.p1
MNPKCNRERTCEVMFEVFKVPSLHIAVQGVLSLYGMGKTSGLVLDAGDGVVHTLPVYDGYGLVHGIRRLDIAGRDLTYYLQSLLAKHHKQALTTRADLEVVRQCKEQCCYVSLDPEHEVATEMVFESEAPNRRSVLLSEERWLCPELLFTPVEEVSSVQHAVRESIEVCGPDIVRHMYRNIVLSGGSTQFPNFQQRLEKELKDLVPAAIASASPPRVLGLADRQFCVWYGACSLANLRSSMAESTWLDKAEYEEEGVQRIHEKMALQYH